MTRDLLQRSLSGFGAAVLAAAPVVAASPAAEAAPVVRQAAAGWQSGACTAGDASSVTVVVDFQQLGGTTIVRCAHGLSAGARGSAALAAAGLSYTGTARWGAAFVCRLQGRPGPTEQLPVNGGSYTEPCTDTPPAAAYWSYWQADAGGSWQYSQLGVTSQKARLGGFEGWSFSLNAANGSSPAPRVATTLVAPAPATTPRSTTRAAPPTTTRTTPRTTAAPTPRSTGAPPSRPTTRVSTTRPPTTASRPAASTRPTSPSRAGTPLTSPPTRQSTTGTTTVGPARTPVVTSSASFPAGPVATTAAPSTAARTSAAAGSSGRATASPSSAPTTTASSGADVQISTSPGSGSGSVAVTASGADSGEGVAVAVDPVSAPAGSPWPVIGVGALVVAGGSAAWLIARRRRAGTD